MNDVLGSRVSAAGCDGESACRRGSATGESVSWANASNAPLNRSFVAPRSRCFRPFGDGAKREPEGGPPAEPGGGLERDVEDPGGREAARLINVRRMSRVDVGRPRTRRGGGPRFVAPDAALAPPPRWPSALARRVDEALGLKPSVPASVPSISGDERDDHSLVLSAAVAWGAGHFSTYNADLRRMKTFAGINIGTPDQTLKRLQR